MIMMKSLLLVSTLLLLDLARGFGLTPPVLIRQRQQQRQQNTELAMGWFDFKPVHGSGSASEEDLDEQWEAQQAILRARRSGGLDKEHLREKYKNKKENQFAKMAKEREREQQKKRDEMIVEEPKEGKKPKFFWEQ